MDANKSHPSKGKKEKRKSKKNEQQRNMCGFLILCAYNIEKQVLAIPFIRLSHVRMAPLMTSRRKALIFIGILLFQMTFVKGHQIPQSLNLRYALFVEKVRVES